MKTRKRRGGGNITKDLKGEWRVDMIRIYLMTEDRMKLTAVVKMATKFLVL
jgi:hypothetical protein